MPLVLVIEIVKVLFWLFGVKVGTIPAPDKAVIVKPVNKGQERDSVKSGTPSLSSSTSIKSGTPSPSVSVHPFKLEEMVFL